MTSLKELGQTWAMRRRSTLAAKARPRLSLDLLRLIEEKGHKALSREDTTRLVLAYKAGDVTAGELLVRANAGLIWQRARWFKKRMFFSDLTVEELFQEGALGFLHALTKFDPSLGNALTTYATDWIEQAMGRSAKNTGTTIRVPIHVHQRSALDAKGTAKDPSQKQGRLVKAGRRAMRCTSLDAPIREDLTLLDLLAESMPSMGDCRDAEKREARMQSILASAMSTLSKREARIVRLRYLLDEPLTLVEVGEQFGLSRERIRQIEAKALRKLAKKISKSVLE